MNLKKITTQQMHFKITKTMIFGTIGLYIQDILEITTIPIFHHIIRQHFENDSEGMEL